MNKRYLFKPETLRRIFVYFQYGHAYAGLVVTAIAYGGMIYVAYESWLKFLFPNPVIFTIVAVPLYVLFIALPLGYFVGKRGLLIKEVQKIISEQNPYIMEIYRNSKKLVEDMELVKKEIDMLKSERK